MRRLPIILATLGATLIMSSPLLAAEESAAEAREKPVQLSEVPKPAMDAATKAIGGNVNQAKMTQEKGQTVYDLEGTDSAGKQKGVHVTSDGKVLKTEKGERGE